MSYWHCPLDAWTTVLGTLRLCIKFIPTQLVKAVLRFCVSLMEGLILGFFLKEKKKAFVIICQRSFKVDTDRSPIYDWNQQHSQSLHHWQEYWYLVWLILSPCWDICIPWVTTSSPSTSLQNPTKWWLFLLSNSFQKGECSFSLKSTGLAVNHFDHNINDGQSLLIQSFISRKSIPPVFWKPQMKSLMLSVYQLKTYWLQICQLLVQWLLERLPKL